MNETLAKGWIEDRWGNAAIDRLQRYADLVAAENKSQNLVANSTLDQIWQRHLLDSAQLIPLAGDAVPDGAWIDIGSGAGLPGIVAAILQERPVRMIEPRRKRVEFLQHVIDRLQLDASVESSRAETARLGDRSASVISARAVADLETLLDMAAPFSHSSTVLLFPKGRSGLAELEDAQMRWEGVFHVEHSLTAPDSVILKAREVKRR